MSERAGISSSVAIREELTRFVCRGLLGPAGGPNEEVTEGRVRERYLTGMKYPHRAFRCRLLILRRCSPFGSLSPCSHLAKVPASTRRRRAIASWLSPRYLRIQVNLFPRDHAGS